MQGSTELAEKVSAATVESVKFQDGMIVTAEDLGAAQQYPVSLLRTVLRAYLGCGVVCGLGLRVKPSPDKKPTWVVCVDRGVAIDCQGYPLELCAAVELDLSPDACSCEPLPDTAFIAVRRITSDAAPKDACTCDTDSPQFDCRRTREHVDVRAFTQAELDDLQATLCRKDPAATKSWCENLTTCSSCTCGDSWIFLGSVKLDAKKGITDPPDTSERPWVKPVDFACSTVADRFAQTETQDKALVDRVTALETQLTALTSAARSPGN
jgi:hypothetical protein